MQEPSTPLARASSGAALTPSERDAVWFHVAFGAVAALGLALPGSVPTGWRLAGIVAIYVVGLPALGNRLGHADWLDLFTFLLPLSVLQVFPDWFLSSVLGVLVFPEDGFPKIGSVSGYMAGLWTLPLFVAVKAGVGVAERRGPAAGYVTASLIALVVFGVSEETLWAVPIWHATNVTLVGHTAPYVLLPEMLLGLLACDGHRRAAGRPLAVKVALAVPVMLSYLGALALSYLLFERRG